MIESNDVVVVNNPYHLISVLLRRLVLALVDLVEEVHPADYTEGNIVEISTVNEGGGSGMHALSSCVLPHGAEVQVSLSVGVGIQDILSLESKLSGDGAGPVGDEIILACVLHSEDRLELVEAKVAIVVAQALCLVCFTEVHEVRHEAVNLVRVGVVGKRERCIVDIDLVGDGAIEPRVLKE